MQYTNLRYNQPADTTEEATKRAKMLAEYLSEHIGGNWEYQVVKISASTFKYSASCGTLYVWPSALLNNYECTTTGTPLSKVKYNYACYKDPADAVHHELATLKGKVNQLNLALSENYSRIGRSQDNISQVKTVLMSVESLLIELSNEDLTKLPILANLPAIKALIDTL